MATLSSHHGAISGRSFAAHVSVSIASWYLCCSAWQLLRQINASTNSGSSCSTCYSEHSSQSRTERVERVHLGSSLHPGHTGQAHLLFHTLASPGTMWAPDPTLHCGIPAIITTNIHLWDPSASKDHGTERYHNGALRHARANSSDPMRPSLCSPSLCVLRMSYWFVAEMMLVLACFRSCSAVAGWFC